MKNPRQCISTTRNFFLLLWLCVLLIPPSDQISASVWQSSRTPHGRFVDETLETTHQPVEKSKAVEESGIKSLVKRQVEPGQSGGLGAQQQDTVESLNYWCRISKELEHSLEARDENQVHFDLFHELFDSSAGLVAKLQYSVRIRQESAREYVHRLEVSHGRLMSKSGTGSQLCDNEQADHLQIVFTTAPINITWTMETTPEVAISVKFTLVTYAADPLRIVGKSSMNRFVLPGCYLKILRPHGSISSGHFLSEMQDNNEIPKAKVNQDKSNLLACTLVLSAPSAAHTIEMNLRKLKLSRSHRDCFADNVIQLGTVNEPFNFSSASWYHVLDDEQSLNVARNYCGKVQDYSKEERWWKSSGASFAFIRLRSRGRHQSSNFFSLKYNVLGPCSNALFTQRQGQMNLMDDDLVTNKGQDGCSFRIHMAYGYKVNLRVTLWSTEQSTIGHEKEQQANKLALDDEDTDQGAADDAPTLVSLESDRCLIVVQMEDATGKLSRCLSLSDRRSTALFTSQTNVVTFRVIRIQAHHKGGSTERERETNGTNEFSDSERNDVMASRSSRDSAAKDQSIKLTVHFNSVAEPSLTNGCEPDWVASDDETCILVHDDPPLGWHQAESKCNQLGSHLVAVTSSFVQQVVDTAITNSPFYEPSRSYWIGASDLKQETSFEWSNGKPLSFAKWFPGWPMYQGYNSQPSDDGFSDQDCVEIRQSFGQPGRNDFMADGMYWNDRDCSVANPFVCQKARNSGVAVTADRMDCNRTEELNRLRPSIIIQSPRYPLSYPESAACNTHLVAPAGYSILLNFDLFDLEDEEDCNYDYVELVEPPGASAPETGSRGQMAASWKRCGNWNSRLKLLRWRSVGNRVDIRFHSDSSYSGHGFQLTATMEKTDLNCPESRSISHQGHCYLIVPYPEIGWTAANEICKTLQAELVIPDSAEELRYLSSQLHSSEQLNSTAFYWIGQVGRFQLSVVHSASDPVHHCPVLRTWPLPGNTSLEPCQSSGGYICETQTAKSNNGGIRNSTIESREGQVKTPNYPLPYSNDAHFRLHIKAANTSTNSERLVVRFKHIDLEYQENCLYDYVALQAYEDGPVTRLCGHHTTNMDRWDYVSETNQVWLTFQSDYSITGSGFHAVWSTISLPGCPDQVIEQPPSGLIQSPHFPHYYLPHLNCTYRLLAPDNMRISLEFKVLEVGHAHPSSVSGGSCFQDYVRVAIGGTASANLCRPHNTSTTRKANLRYISNSNQLDVQLISQAGKQGRGYQASYRFETTPTLIRDIVTIGEEEKMEIAQLNYPMPMPLNVSHQLVIVAPHGSFLSFESATLKPCAPSADGVAIRAVLRDIHNGSSPLQLCSASPGSDYTYESVFHTLELTYEQLNKGSSVILGRIRAARDGNYTAKISGWPNHSPVEACDLKPCQNEGVCTANNSLHYCHCRGKWRGLFCSLTLCQLSLCVHGTCSSVNDTQMCVCESGFTGPLCDTPVSPCDLDPCHGRGDCLNTENGFQCQCHAWWQGPRCETRWLQIPYKPLSQRMFEEPFWLGLMTMAAVLVIIGFVWCIKRHFAEKLERFVTEELERGKLVNDHGSPMGDWRRGRNNRPSLEPMLQSGVHAFSRPSSPQSTSLNIPNADANSQRNFLGFRKPSLLSITSLLSPCQISTVASPSGRRDTGRTFSLDDLFRSPRRSPSPAGGKRSSDNDVVSSQQRDSERQQILQRLVASHVPRAAQNRMPENLLMASLSADGKAVIGRHSLTGDEQSTDTDTILETVIGPSVTSQLDLKAEKRVTFARMLDLVSMELHSSSDTDISAGEEAASIRSAGRDQKLASQPEQRHPPRRKARNWSSRRFWRAPNSNSSTQGSASDHDIEQNTVTTSMIAQVAPNEPKGANGASSASQRRSNRLLRLPCRTTTDRQSSSTESLLTIIRSLSGTHKTPSTPSSPQISDYELSSSFPTPISTPGSPAGSLETLPSTSGNNDSAHSIQVTVIDPSSMPRSSRSSGSNLNTPHITLEIPTPNYGYYLSPIHEVPTPLPSPSHTPLPSLKRQNAVPTSESSSGSPQMKRHTDSDMSASDETASGATTERPKLPPVPLITICCEDGIAVHVPTGPDNKQSEVKVSPLPSSAPASPSFPKSKPPPLNIINSNFARFEKLQRSMEQVPIANPPPAIAVIPAVPVFCISEPSPDESPTKSNSCLNWERVNIGSPPVRKHRDNPASFINEGPVRRILKDTGDKSSSLDLPAAPPMITITANFSEVESDTDTGLLGGGGINGPNKMCYLSPFACYGARQDIGASESNLSSSGYSSMASPGPSPSCSSKTLSVLEGDEIGLSRQIRRRGRDRPMLHRALSPSLESSSPPPDSPPAQNKGLFLTRNIQHCTDSDVTDDQMMMAEPVEIESTADYDDSNDEGIDVDHIREKIDTGELKSARELETFISIEMKKPEQTDIDLKLLNVNNRVQKSRSLDSKLKGERQNKLKSDSLDTKLLSLQQNEGAFKFPVQSLLIPESMAPSWIPQGSGDGVVGDDGKKRGSPVSSRSESPLSDAKSAGFGRFSAQFYGMSRPDLPYTDSDGLYDYPSSEAVLPVANVNRRNSRKCDRRRERKASLQLGRAEHEGAAHGRSKISLLEPEAERIPSRLQSNKRRTRAHNHLDFYASSSSNESLSASHRRSPRRMTNRRRFDSSRRTSPSSPVCDVILTIQAASSAEESQSEEISYNRSSPQSYGAQKSDIRILRLPSRSRHTGRLLSSRMWRRQDSGSKRREQASVLKNRRPASCDSSPLVESAAFARRDSFSSCLSDSDCEDSNESLANLAEIDDSTDSPADANELRRT